MKNIYIESLNNTTNLNLQIENDNKRIFGDGTHDSTKAILSLLSTQKLDNKNIIDLGCGTGILSIAAQKWGAKQLSLIDKLDIQNIVKINMNLNHISNYTFEQQDIFNYNFENIKDSICLLNIEFQLQYHFLLENIKKILNHTKNIIIFSTPNVFLVYIKHLLNQLNDHIVIIDSYRNKTWTAFAIKQNNEIE